MWKRVVLIEGYNGIFMGNTLGCLYTVLPNQRGCFILLLLLDNVPRPTSVLYFSTVNEIWTKNHDELHLLEDDSHCDILHTNAATSFSPRQIFQLIAVLWTTYFSFQTSLFHGKILILWATTICIAFRSLIKMGTSIFRIKYIERL